MTGQKHYICGFVMLLVVGFVFSQAPAWADAFESGVNHYNAGRYRHAVIFLSAAAGQDPNNALVHYYLANSLVHQDRHDDAKVEYELCYELDPAGPVAGYCLAALKKYGKKIEGLSASEGSDPDNYTKSLKKANNPKGLGTTNLEKAKSVIRRQATCEKEKHRSAGYGLAQQTMNQAERNSLRIRSQAKEDIERALNPPLYIRGVSGSLILNPDFGNAELARARAQIIRNQMEERVGQIKEKARLMAEAQRRTSSDKEYVLDEVVANLENQLEGPTGRSGVKLQAVGTDLYVRYYGHKRFNEQMPDVHPAVVRIVNPDGIFGNIDDTGVSPGSSGRRPTRVVKGKLVN